MTAGDRITLEVRNRYDSYNPATDNLISDQSFFQNLLTTMVTGPEGSPAEQGQVQLVNSMFGSQNMSIFEMMSDMALDPGRPPAALNYILYNNQLQIVGAGSG
ncbi:hypothetical protein LWM68_20235 [Niabella sp. W65]|nr:hypothetical protein [Niabella sp. W65]MCH7364885.1 hypothetical protein [Niabella sp. W65]